MACVEFVFGIIRSSKDSSKISSSSSSDMTMAVADLSGMR